MVISDKSDCKIWEEMFRLAMCPRQRIWSEDAGRGACLGNVLTGPFHKGHITLWGAWAPCRLQDGRSLGVDELHECKGCVLVWDDRINPCADFIGPPPLYFPDRGGCPLFLPLPLPSPAGRGSL